MRTVPLADILQLCDLEKRAFSNTAMRTLQHAGIGAGAGAVAGGAYGAYTAAPGQGWQGAARGAAVGGAIGGGAAGLGSYLSSRTAGKAITGLRKDVSGVTDQLNHAQQQYGALENNHAILQGNHNQLKTEHGLVSGEVEGLRGKLDDAHAGLRQHQLAHEGTLADLTDAQQLNARFQDHEAAMAATLRDKAQALEEAHGKLNAMGTTPQGPAPHQKVQSEIDDFLAAARSNPNAGARTPDIRSEAIPAYNQSATPSSGVRRRDTPESRAATVVSPRPAAPPAAMPGAMRPPGTPPPLPIRGRTAGFEQSPPQVRTASLKLASLGIGGGAGLGALTIGGANAIDAYRAQPEGERDWGEVGKAGLRGAVPGALLGGSVAALARNGGLSEGYNAGHEAGISDQQWMRDLLGSIQRG